MQLMANAETVDRLVKQGSLLLKAFHDKQINCPDGGEVEFLRGEFTGWRSTLHTEYHQCAEEIVDRVITETCLPIPTGKIGTVGARVS